MKMPGSKPAPFIYSDFTRTLIENLKGVNYERRATVSEQTNFLMEMFKFMPKAEVAAAMRGQMSPEGSVTEKMIESVGYEDVSGKYVPTSIQLVRKILNQFVTLGHLVSGQYILTESAREKIENNSLSLSRLNILDFCNDVLAPVPKNIPKYIERLEEVLYTAYKKSKLYPTHYKAYDEEFMRTETVVRYAGPNNTNPYNLNLTLPFRKSISDAGFGFIHRQTTPQDVMGEYDLHYSVADIGVGRYNGDGSNYNTGTLDRALTVFDPDSEIFQGIDSTNPSLFDPTDYVGMVFGLNPMTMKVKTSAEGLPDVVDYGNYFREANSYFRDIYIRSNFGSTMTNYGVIEDAVYNENKQRPNYYQIVKDLDAPWNNTGRDENNNVTYSYQGWWSGKESQAGDAALYLMMLMVESKRRYSYAMTEMLGPHTQGWGFTGYEGLRSQYDDPSEAEGCGPLDKQDDVPAYYTGDYFSKYDGRGYVDHLMINRFDKWWRDNKLDWASGYQLGFLYAFVGMAHTNNCWLDMFTNKIKTGVDTADWRSPSDAAALNRFQAWLKSSLENRTRAKNDYQSNIVNEYNTFKDLQADGIVVGDDDDAKQANYKKIKSGASQILSLARRVQFPTYRTMYRINILQKAVSALEQISSYDKSACSSKIADICSSAQVIIGEEDKSRANENNNIMQLLKELTGDTTDQFGTTNFGRLPGATYNHWTSWDKTKGATITNFDAAREYIDDSHHYYSPAWSVVRSTSAELNYNKYNMTDGEPWYFVKKSGSEGLHDGVIASPRQKMWMPRANFALREAYWVEENIRFIMDLFINKTGARKAREGQEEYREELKEEERADARAEAASKRSSARSRKMIERAMAKQQANDRAMRRKHLRPKKKKANKADEAS